MNDKCKPINTEYKGYLFRSRLEARWAVWFDSILKNADWEYEKEGYELESGWYLPDFWLPFAECWLEIKGQKPTDLEIKQGQDLAYETGNPVCLAVGLPGQQLSAFCYDTCDSGGGELWWECQWGVYENNLCLCTDLHGHTLHKTDWSTLPDWCFVKSTKDAILLPERAFYAARAARFEHHHR